MFMYTSSQGKSNCCHSKSEFQMFSLFSGCHIGVLWRLFTELYKIAWNVSGNISRTVYRTHLRPGEVVYILIFCNI